MAGGSRIGSELHGASAPSGAVAELRGGWRIVLAALVGIAFGVTGLFFYSAGIFLKPVSAEFGWSRAALSAVNLVAALSLAGTAPFVGWVVDRVGVRVVALVSSCGLAAGFLLLSMAPGSLPFFLLLIGMTALLGAGASPVGFTRLVNLWFDKARGTALGLAQMATGIAGALLPPLLAPYVAEHGWRAGYVALAVVALASGPLVVLLIGRSGLASSSTSPSDRSPGPRALTSAPWGMTLTEALHTPVFFTLAAVFVLAAIGVGGMIVHLVPMLTDAGLTPAHAGAVAGLLGLAIIFGRAVTGVIVDRVFAPRVAFVAFALAACGCWLLAWGGALWAAGAAVLVGFAMGAEVDLISYLVARYFGLASYGRIYGWLYAVFMVGTSIGPVLAGAAFDRFGNYDVALAVLGSALALAAAATLRLAPFPR
jgi:MFS family permease